MYKIGSSFRAVRPVAVSGVCRRAVIATTVRSLFITTESALKINPHFMKFIPDREVLPKVYGPQWPLSHHEEEKISRFPLAANIFKVGNGQAIDHIFITRTYINVGKHKDQSWTDLEPAVRNAILDFYANPRAEFELDPPPYVPEKGESEAIIEEYTRKNVKHAVRLQRERDGTW